MISQETRITAFYWELIENLEKERRYEQRTNSPQQAPDSIGRFLFNELRERIKPTPPPELKRTPLTLTEGLAILRDVFSGAQRAKLKPWYIISEVIARLPEAATPVALDYAQAHTAAWTPEAFPYRFGLKPPDNRANVLALHLNLQVDATNAEPKLQELRSHADPSQTRRLQLASASIESDTLTRSQLSALIQGGPCRALKSLELDSSHLHSHLGWLMTEAPELSGLEELTLQCHYAQPVAARELISVAGSPHLGALKRLTLVHHDWSSVDTYDPTMRTWPNLPQLEHLKLCGHYLNQRPVAFWTEQKHLLHLVLKHVVLKTAALGRFVQHGGTTRLQTLHISNTELSAALIEQLCAAPFEELRSLALTHIPLSSQELQQLYQAAQLPQLEALNLTRCSLDAQAIEALLEAPLIQQLNGLNLAGNDLNPQVLRALDSLAARGTLKKLGLRECKLTDREAYTMLGLTSLPKLEVVSFDNAADTLDEELFKQLQAMYS